MGHRSGRGLRVMAPVLALYALLAGCGGAAPDPTSLYPMEPGLTWRYRVVTVRKGNDPVTAIRTLENVSRGPFAGFDDVTVRRNNYGARYYVAQRPDGYYRLAMKSVASDAPTMDHPMRRILPLPATQGSRWRQVANAYLLNRAATFITDKSSGAQLTLDYRIESTQVEVTVPAGHFEGCTLALGKLTFHLGAGAGFAPTDVPIVQKEWYCPGVGLVRLERDEKLTSANRYITGGHISLKLIEGPA